jgi:hypothetical protein
VAGRDAREIGPRNVAGAAMVTGTRRAESQDEIALPGVEAGRLVEGVAIRALAPGFLVEGLRYAILACRLPRVAAPAGRRAIRRRGLRLPLKRVTAAAGHTRMGSLGRTRFRRPPHRDSGDRPQETEDRDPVASLPHGSASLPRGGERCAGPWVSWKQPARGLSGRGARPRRSARRAVRLPRSMPGEAGSPGGRDQRSRGVTICTMPTSTAATVISRPA